MSDRDGLAALIYGLDLPARYSLDPDESGEIADAILAAFDVTPKPIDTEPPPAETFNAITDWREPVPGWDTVTYKTLGSAVVTREYTVPVDLMRRDDTGTDFLNPDGSTAYRVTLD